MPFNEHILETSSGNPFKWSCSNFRTCIVKNKMLEHLGQLQYINSYFGSAVSFCFRLIKGTVYTLFVLI